MLWFILFIFGLAIGSFLNVVATRYDEHRFILDQRVIGGRSHCTHCGGTLRWFELVPLVSYIAQGGRCRRCKAKLSVQYPLVELLSGLIFAFVPLALSAVTAPTAFALTATLWVVAFESLLVMTLIDIRTGIIPDEISILLAIAGVLLLFAGGVPPEAAVANAVLSALGAGVFFAILIAVTRGKGMGMGDLKLSIPLGLLFGFPGIVLLLMLSFVIGAAVGVASIARGRKTMKGTLPFGPFLATAAAVTFFWGAPIISWYLGFLK